MIVIYVLVAIVAVVLIGAGASVRVVQQFERGVVFRFGRVRPATRGPGLALTAPVARDLREEKITPGAAREVYGVIVNGGGVDDPATALTMLRRRKLAAGGRGPVFPGSRGGWRDPSNTSRDLRNARGSEGIAWVTNHVCRKTAATELDQAGLSARQIADQLGHSKVSMTQDALPRPARGRQGCCGGTGPGTPRRQEGRRRGRFRRASAG